MFLKLMKKNKNFHFSGFTLIELLLAFALFSVIGVTLVSIFSVGMKVSRRSGSEAGVMQKADIALGLMTSEIENMVFFQLRADAPVWESSENELYFILPVSNGLRLVKYSLKSPDQISQHQVVIGDRRYRNVAMSSKKEANDLNLMLLVREQEDLMKYFVTESFSEDQTEVVLDDIVSGSLKISYGFIDEEKEFSHVWKEEWDGFAAPANISFELKMRADEGAVVELQRDVFIPQGARIKNEI